MLEPSTEKIFTHDEAMRIAEIFEDILDKHGIKLPSDEDDDRDPSCDAALWGSTYDLVLTGVEDRLKSVLDKHTPGTEVITDVFSGTV